MTIAGAGKSLAPARALVYISKIMTTVIIIIHVLVCLALISIVLLQHGKGAGIGAAFGGSSQTVFGSTGAAPFLGQAHCGGGQSFLCCTSLGLTFLGRQQEVSVMQGVRTSRRLEQKTTPAPAPPAAPAEKLRPHRPSQMNLTMPKWWNLVDTPS